METINYLIFFVIALIATRTPVIGKYFRSINTMNHENGHSFSSLLTGGVVHRIDLFANTEGVATTGSRWWLGRVITSLAGYPYASFMAYIFYYFLLSEKYDLLFYGLAVIVILNLILWVRNLYGIIWLISLISLLGGLHYVGNEQYIEYSLLFIGSILLVDSIASALVIFILSLKNPNDAGDTTNLKNSTLISARFWGLLFLSQSLWFGYLIADMII
jgi:hypothetical protein